MIPKVIDFQRRIYAIAFEDPESIWKLAQRIDDLLNRETTWPRFCLIEDPLAHKGDFEAVLTFLDQMKRQRSPVENIQRTINRRWRKILPEKEDSSIWMPDHN